MTYLSGAHERTTEQKRFLGTFQQQGAGLRPAAFNRSLTEALEDLPEHCIRDVAGYRVLRVTGALLVLAQLLTAYAALTAFVYVAKND